MIMFVPIKNSIVIVISDDIRISHDDGTDCWLTINIVSLFIDYDYLECACYLLSVWNDTIYALNYHVQSPLFRVCL